MKNGTESPAEPAGEVVHLPRPRLNGAAKPPAKKARAPRPPKGEAEPETEAPKPRVDLSDFARVGVKNVQLVVEFEFQTEDGDCMGAQRVGFGVEEGKPNPLLVRANRREFSLDAWVETTRKGLTEQLQREKTASEAAAAAVAPAMEPPGTPKE